jgi:hypothetical protein
MTKKEYLGTTRETVTLSIRITYQRCNRTDVKKLLDPDWKGLPDTPEPVRSHGANVGEIVDIELERMKEDLARAHRFDDENEGPEGGPPITIH